MKRILILGDETGYKFHCLTELQPLTDMLEKEYKIELCNEYGTLTKEELAAYEAVISYIDNWAEKGSLQAESAIVSYVEEGGRLLVLHCGIITKSAQELLQLCGGSFLGHDRYQVLLYEKTQVSHPVTDNFEPFAIEEEPYRFALSSPQDTQIFLTYALNGEHYPAGWIRKQKKGYMLYLVFGHNSNVFRHKETAGLCIRSLDWLMEKPDITFSAEPVLEPKPGCEWADTMVLNPAIMKDGESGVLHMLFRATGPWKCKNLKGRSDPYPIFLGYAVSEDNGDSWKADFTRPALAPRLSYDREGMYIEDDRGEKVVNYANGCIEDPRIFPVEGEYYVSAACRMFPPGPYWEGNRKKDNQPDWAAEEGNPFGSAATRNDTTTVLYKLYKDKLKSGQYEEAFQYVCALTDGSRSDNRDVFLFPRKMMIEGKMQYVMLHRPDDPDRFPTGEGVHKPSIFLAAAEEMRDFVTVKATHQMLAKPEFDWEEERVGASFPPIELGNGEWLVSYHGKQLPDYGYTQSFMILREKENDFPQIIHRCSERLIYARQKWELPDKFLCPCIFTTGGIIDKGELIMSYGAADQKIGIARVKLEELTGYIRQFDSEGLR